MPIPYYNYYQPQPQPQPQPQISQNSNQYGGFVSVRNETEARNYPVAPGNSVLFRDETSPHIYSKTMGYSQLDIPKFDKYRLVKEDDTTACEPHADSLNNNTDILSNYTLKSEFEALQQLVGVLEEDIAILKNPKRRVGTKKETGADE